MYYKKGIFVLFLGWYISTYPSFASFFQPLVTALIGENSFLSRMQLITARNKGYVFGRKALVLKAGQNTQFIVISNVQGDKASFERILHSLRERALLSENLKLTNAHTYIILNGNMIGATSFNKNVLECIMDLVEMNPMNVFYVRGTFEDKEQWLLQSSFNHEIEAMAYYQAHKIVRDFFNGFPLALYIITENYEQLPFRVSYQGVDSPDFRTLDCTKRVSLPVEAVCQLDSLCAYKEVLLACFIVGEDKGVSWHNMQGLAKTVSPLTWHIFSSPVDSYKQQHGFFNDAYVIITLGKSLRTTALSLYYNDTRKKEGFIRQGPFGLLE